MFRNRFFLSAVGFSSFTLSSGSIYSSTKLYSSSNTNNNDNEEFENTNEASSTSRKSNASSSAAVASTYSEKFEEFLLPTTALVQLYDYKSPRRRFVTLTFGADGFHLQNMVEGIRRDLKNQIALNKAISANSKREKWNIKQTKQRSIVLDCTSVDGRDNGDTEMADVLTTSLMQRVINHVELFGYSLAKAYVTLTPDDRPVASRERLMYHYLLFRRDGIQMSLEDQEQENGVAEGNAYDQERLAYREEKNHNNNITIGGNDEDAATNSSASLEEQEENSIDSVSSLKTLNELLRQHQQRKQLQDPSAPVEEQLEEKSAQQGHQNEVEEDEDVTVTRSDEHQAEAEIDDDVTITIDGREVNYDENKLEVENNANTNDSISKRRSVYSSFNRVQQDEEVQHETIQQQQQHQHSEATLESSASIETENFSAQLEPSQEQQEEQQQQTAASSLPIAMEFPDADPKAATEEIQDSFSKQADNEQEQLLAEISTQNQTQNNNNNYNEEVNAASSTSVSNDFASALLENQKEFEEMSFVKPGPDETKFASESEHSNDELQQQQQESDALSTSSFDDVAEEGEIVGSAASESAESLQAHEPIAQVDADDILNIFASSLDASSFVIPTPTTSRQVSVADENVKNQKLIHESSLAEDSDVASSVISAPAEHKRRGRGKGRRVKNDKKNSNQNQDQLSSEIPSDVAAATSPSTTTTTSEATIVADDSNHETSEVAASEEAETKQQHNEITENQQVADLSAAASLPFVADPRRPGGDGVKIFSEVQEPEQVEKVEAQQRQQEEDDVDVYDSSLEDIFGSSMDLSESPTIKPRQQNEQHQSVKENQTEESSASSETTEQKQQQQQQQQATDQFYAWYGEASAQQMY